MKAPENPCRHHWRIETPNGRTSLGVCRICGAERHFINSHPADDFRVAAEFTLGPRRVVR